MGQQLIAEARHSIDVLYGAFVQAPGRAGVPDDFVPSIDDELEAVEGFTRFIAALPPGQRWYMGELLTNVHDLPWPERALG